MSRDGRFCAGGLWSHDFSEVLMAVALIESLLVLSFSDGQWGHSVCCTPSPQTSIFFKLILSFLLVPPKTPPVPVEWLFFVCPPALSRFYHFLWRVYYPGPPRTCAAPRSLQECAGACNRLCRGHWVVRLTETSQPHSVLAAEWRSAWGSSPTRGRCQIPTVALHNHSHTGPGAGRRDWEGGGGRVGQRNGEVYLIQYQNCHIWLSIANL